MNKTVEEIAGMVLACVIGTALAAWMIIWWSS